MVHATIVSGQMKGACRKMQVTGNEGAVQGNMRQRSYHNKELRTVGLIGADYSPVHRKQPKTGLKCRNMPKC